MGNPTRIFPDDPAHGRYRELVESLGFEPTNPHDLTALAHVAMWDSHENVRRVASLIREARERDVSLLRQVADAIKDNAEQIITQGVMRVDLPSGLARQIHARVNGGTS